MAIGSSISIISKNTTYDHISQTLVTYYQDAAKGTEWPNNLSIVRRKHGLSSSQVVESAWGTSLFQLYHTSTPGDDDEEIKVYKYRNNEISNPPVTEINLRERSDRLTFDVYQNWDQEFEIYLVSLSDDWSSNSVINTLYRHDIKYNGWREDQLNDLTSLSQTCADIIRVNDILIAVACKSNSRMTFLERQTMEMLPSSFELQSTEEFHSISDISMMEYGANGLEYESDFMEVITVKGHSYIFFVSYSS